MIAEIVGESVGGGGVTPKQVAKAWHSVTDVMRRGVLAFF